MLPVSGALQLNDSGPISERPMISHSGAYSRLVRPAPSSDSGRKRFQSACARAFSFSDSTARVGFHGSPAARLAATSAWNPASAGNTCSFMNAETFACSSFVLGEYAKSMGFPLVLRVEHRLDLPPAFFRDRARAPSRCEGFGARGIALQRAGHHALQDRRQAEHVVGDVVLEMVDAIAARGLAIHRDVFVLGGNFQRREIDAGEAARVRPFGHAPRHAVVRKIRERMAERGELPVEHGQDARLGGMEDHVFEAMSAGYDRRFLAGGD